MSNVDNVNSLSDQDNYSEGTVTKPIGDAMRLSSDNPLAKAIIALQERLRDKHKLDSRIGFEWEFQILNDEGKPQFPPYNLIKDHPFIKRIYREQPYGVYEITTAPSSPLEAAKAMVDIQAQVTQWARENGYHLSAAPVITNSRVAEGTTGMHVNSSLVNAGGDENAPSLLSETTVFKRGDQYTSDIDGLTANVAHSILKINAETPLWSWQSELDANRLGRHNTPNFYNVGDNRGKTAIAVRANKPIPYSPEEIGRDPFSGEEFYAVRVEERLANARVDPYVMAFRTLLAQYDALEHPTYALDSNVDIRTIRAGAIPQWQEVASKHLSDDSVVRRYVGDLYDESTLQYIDERGRTPFMPSWESGKFALQDQTVSQTLSSSPVQTDQGGPVNHDISPYHVDLTARTLIGKVSEGPSTSPNIIN